MSWRADPEQVRESRRTRPTVLNALAIRLSELICYPLRACMRHERLPLGRTVPAFVNSFRGEMRRQVENHRPAKFTFKLWACLYRPFWKYVYNWLTKYLRTSIWICRCWKGHLKCVFYLIMPPRKLKLFSQRDRKDQSQQRVGRISLYISWRAARTDKTIR